MSTFAWDDFNAYANGGGVAGFGVEVEGIRRFEPARMCTNCREFYPDPSPAPQYGQCPHRKRPFAYGVACASFVRAS